jgi:Ca2+-binding EF-hand superfamily protein
MSKSIAKKTPGGDALKVKHQSRLTQVIISEKKQQQMLSDILIRTTHFNKFEVECLTKLFTEQTLTKLERSKFRDVLHNEFDMTDDLIMDRVFKAFDRDNDGYVSLEEWVRGLSVFLRGTMTEHVQFCFEVYDLHSDGYISRDEMFALLKKSMVRPTTDEDPDEGIKDLVELALKKLDEDQDHRVSFEDFVASINKENLLLQGFGQCLPDEKQVQAFNEMYLHSERK